MSHQYNLTPPPSGKVILYTTSGEIEIELFAKETPKACRNFVQLCLEGYYDGCLFFRIVPDFIVQTGDSTGTGSGGETIYGKKFQDEFNSRLKFFHRGFVATAGTNNENDSQFFITLDRANDLNFKHTIFGKVAAGDTIYNVLKMAELEIDANNRPRFPPKIIKTEVLWNPFPDIEIRKKQVVKDQTKKPKKKAVKNKSLLSFGDEVEQVDELGGIASSHDVLSSKKLSSQAAVEIPTDPIPQPTEQPTLSEKSISILKRARMIKSANASKSAPVEQRVEEDQASAPVPDKVESEDLPEQPIPKKRKALKLKKSSTGAGKSYLEEQREKYGKKKRSREDTDREDEALRKIAKFTNSLGSSRQAQQAVVADNESDDDKSWKMKRLQFDKTTSHRRETEKAEEDFEVLDPLLTNRNSKSR